MGHSGHLKDEYQELVTRLNAGQVGMPEPTDEEARHGWQEILEILYTPEEAALAARMPIAPASLATIARRVGGEPETLRRQLDAMADKGIVMDLVDPQSGEPRYFLSPPVVGFFEFSMMRHDDLIPKRRMAEALEAYAHGDRTFAAEVFGGDTVIGRAMAHETALPTDILPEVLAWERATAAVENADLIGVQYCYCRHLAEHLGKRCDAPIDTCMSLNAGAEFGIRRGFARRVDKAEGLEVLARARESGLVQIADNVRNEPTYLCNCCGCCCGQLRGINDFSLPAVSPSGFQPVLHAQECKGCARCARACPIAAIGMAPYRDVGHRNNGMLPAIDLTRCIGCGVCVDACRNHGLGMERRDRQPYVPLNSLERVVRMALERGKLPHLLFDVGASRGSRFLNAVVQALCALPPVERLLAHEQVRSRFVTFVLRGAGAARGGGHADAKADRP